VEERALHEEKMNRDLQMLQRMLETKFANEVAEFAGQFFDTVENATHLEEAAELEPEPQSQTPQHSASAQQNDANESLPALLVHNLLLGNE
jgi:hydrogenase maturation factor HypF (carbamoyltransferase family)